MNPDQLRRHFAMIGALRGELLSIRLLREPDLTASNPVLLWKWVDDAIAMIDEELNLLRQEVSHEGRDSACHD